MKIELDVHDGSEDPPRGVSGYFVVWLHLQDRPVILYRGANNPKWRSGCRVEKVDAWAGPLPERDVA